MEEIGKYSKVGLYSPEPKRFSLNLSQMECFSLERSQSCETEQQNVISELNDIIGTSNFPSFLGNSSPLFKRFSSCPPDREGINPIIFDEKFIEMEHSLSTSEDSSSDNDV